MFEAHVLHLLRKYLGEYVEGLSTEALRISVWKGDVVLKDLKLKAEALNSLKLPVTVKAGFVGTITLKVPWKRLGKEPVVVLIDRVFVLAHPAPDGQTLKEEDREKIFDAKLQQIEEAESAALDAASRSSKSGTTPDGSSWLSSLIGTIIGNLKVTISNVHIRYEDSVSNPGHPFCSGITLLKLAAVTMDEKGNETFDTSGALDKLRKSVQLQRLAVYHDSDSAPWKLNKKWEDLNPKEWTETFQEGIDEPASYGVVSKCKENHRYLVSPINGVLKYHRLGKNERQDPDIPFEKASLVLSDVSLTMSEAQYYDGIKLIETFSRYKTHVDVSHLRPVISVSQDPHAWWRYAALAGLQQKKLCYWFSWERVRHLCQLRRRYVQLYAASLQHALSVDLSEIRQIEKILDSKVVILWRLLAHAKVESVKSKEASQRKGNLERSWWSFGWRTTSEDASAGNSSSDTQLVEEDNLTKEEWQAIHKMLSYQADEDAAHLPGKDLQNLIQILVDVSIGQAAARIINIHQTEIVCGRFEQLHVTTKLYNKSISCDVSLKFYGLSSPEGSLAQSFISEKKINALDASFVHAPVGEDVDWRLSAAIAPCHATILIESYDRFVEFVKRSNAVSPTVAMETASALQMKIEKVTRRAQEQLQMVLEEKSSFALDIDFDAPKVMVPMKCIGSTLKQSQFLLDFGHFTLHTREGQLVEQRQSLYSRFYISGRDMTAFFTDDISEADCQSSVSLHSKCIDPSYSLLDRCGMSVIIDQIKIPHPSYPSTRVSVQVPNLGVHLSPERYCRIMELLNIFYGSEENSDHNTSELLRTGHMPWHPADLSTVSRVLVWKGISHSLAQWHPCYLILSGLYLYVLESESSQNYQKCCSMAGRQVFEVSPTSVGGSLYTVAVSSRGYDVQKALESTSTLIIEFRDDEEKSAWLKALVQATYRASAPPKIDILGESVASLSESGGAQPINIGSADLVINGTLVETKLLIYGKLDRVHENADEELILELLGAGGKLNVVQSGGELTVKTKLHSLKIKDELQGRLSKFPQYLACSVLNDSTRAGGSSAINVAENESLNFAFEEDDCFKDAMQDFLSTPDHSLPSDFISNLVNCREACEQHIAYSDALSKDKDQVKGKTGEIFYETRDENVSDFVAVTFLTRNSESPLYEDIDTQLCIRMSALEFFCNRPTLVALIDFGLDVTLVSSRVSSRNDMDIPVSGPTCTGVKEENGQTLINGLLGYGKGRAVFNLTMDVDSVCVFLNKEDDSQLAKFVQESFLLDLKVHPSSVSIDSTLGNMRLCDLSLGADNNWRWLCDTRNQGSESLIKFFFQSFSIDDDDYQGYDYSLAGRLSAVRIVFLYRFVQEITSYFMELASPHTEEAIKLVDKVGGIEWLIQKYEIEGAAAVKLDLSLDTPIIIIPKNSMSGDYMQLDLGQLRVKNNFSWHGCQENDPSAVHLDILHAELHGVNMAIGINGLLGKPMVQDCQGFNIRVRRSLRDVFRKVPTLAIEVQVGLLHGVMSAKEYNVILNCLYMNLYEQPKLPPSFRGNAADTKDSIRMLADKVNLSGQVLLSRTIVVVAVEVNYALLQLNIGLEESPLAQIALEGLWLSYRSSSLSEMDVYLTIPKFSILDIRPDTKPEMRLMLGSYTDIFKTGMCNVSDSTGASLVSSVDNVSFKNLENSTDTEVSNLTMLIMDYRWRPSFQSFVIRIQQPRILVVLDFILAVVEFFVPALGTITGREETMNPKNDPLKNSDNIVLSESVYRQKEEVVRLSPRRQLIVDGCGIEEFTYDGCGGTISLSREFDFKRPSISGMIIIIGRGKKLRFKNVKIENGNLLKKCTYLSNESGFSISADDGVEVSLLDSFSSEMNEECRGQNNECMDETAASVTMSEVVSSIVPSFTFEAQVVSPELTFYDCSKLSLDDASHLEKLLRAKMDFSFMYAWKEKDTWARSLVKDLTIETGSGVVVLEPLDIQGGYTSVRDKTNISLLSTDICIHLPLSVVSLILQLQNQASAALEFGNTNPLASCTNFKRLWVSSKGHFPGYNLTFWRPQAPPNYVILGDCVTSRPIPPSRVVVAVSNMYGRVRKPLGFKLIGSLSNFQELGDENESKNDDYSVWIPIAPPGYTTLGCVTHVGNQPPPCHIVYCLRSDLVASSAFSDCLFYVPANSRISTGFSIWRVDNGVGSFYAHTSVNCPPIVNCFDLHQILMPNHDWCDLGSNQSSSNNSVDNYQPGDNQSSVSSGWDILRSMSRSSYYMSTPHFERIWWEKGCDVRKPISIWRPLPRPGFAVLGDCITEGLEPPALGLVFKCDDSVISAKPVQFTKVAHILRKGLDEAFFWYPIPPPGYASLGCVVTRTDEAPTRDLFCCPRIDLVNQTNISEEPISRSSSSRGSNCWSIWRVENQAYTFLTRSDLKKPSSRLAYSISDYVKPRTRENVTAEMKLGFFSLTVMDNLFGTMTPLFDTTITNISLATHGRLEAMNAVLICSIAASTFNRRLEAWEPVIEPFDGIFKLETYDASERPPSKIGKRVRIAATSTVNLNVSAANIETLTEAIVSWGKQVDMQKKISKFEEEDESLRHTDDLTYSALEEEDSQRVIVVNKLGCDIYLRKSEEISENIELLQHDNQTSFLLPSPRFSDRLNVVSKSRETRYYVAVQIFEAKGLPIVDDGNSHDYFCALRLLSDSNASDQRKLFPQSARTRCAKPLITKANGLSEGYAKWNELFIFEVPENGLANLDVEVTNLSSRAGKGEVIGALCLPIGTTASTLKRAASVRILQQAADVQHFSSYRLKRKIELATNDDNKYAGSLVISTSCFERNIDSNFQRGVDKSTMSDRDDSFCVGLGPDGPWERISSLLPLSVVPKSLNKDPFAFEVIMRNGKKHVILRSLAVVVNETDVRLQVSICPASMLNNPLSNKGPKSPAVFTEEIFENQLYQPISGWGNKSSGSHHTEPGRWSTRDFLKSSKDFFEPPLPPAWRWTSAWKIERSPLVDSDGWAYGTDFRSLNWPPTSTRSSSKSALDFVRRRRWVRTRQQLQEEYISNMRNVVAVINPDSSAVLPWTSMAKDTEFCLQIRPYAENSNEEYTWGQTVTLSGKDQSIIQQASNDTQNNVKYSNTQMQNRMLQLNRLEKIDVLLYSKLLKSTKQYFWLGVGTDASVLHTEFNTPIYDWKISINSPLRLENKLPYQAEYAIWERTVDGNMAEQQHGIISPAGCAFVNSADLRKPIYLTLFVQGGWVLEKESILIMDLLGLSHVSSFWMVQQRSNRKLRVSVEHDMGGTEAAPKIVRLFVPYWISNDLSTPLSYRIVEVDPSENLEPESLSISRAVKSAKFAFKNSSKALDRKPSSRRNTQIYEIIEDINPKVMLSPQYYVSRSGISSMPSRNDNISSEHVGISVAVRHSEYYSPGISLLELERKERIDVRAFASDGSYYKMSAQLKMASNRTKVIHFLPQILFINRVGRSLALSQYNTESEEWLHPDDPPKQLKWQSGASNELLRLRLDGYKWSTPFSIQNEGVMCVCMKNDKQNGHKYLRVEVRSGTKISRHEVLFHLVSLSSPYRIENRSMFLPLWFRQVDSSDDSWQRLLPNAAASFCWEDIGRQRLLEVMFDGTGSSRSEKYNIDEVMDYQPVQTSSRPIRALRFTVLKEGKIQIGRISDWMSDNESSAVMAEKAASPIFKPYESGYGGSAPNLESEFHVSFELAELGVSIIDHMPEEILYMSMQNLLLSYSSGLGSGISRFKLRMHSIQVDNQLPFSPMPVLFRPQRVGDELEYILKFSMTMQTNNSLDLCVYPYIGLQGPDNSAFFINVHEPIVWRLHDMFQRVKLNTVFRTPATAVSVDPTIKIGLLNFSEIRFKFSMAMSPAQRPRGVLGFWSSLMTALGNTEHMPVRITQRFCEELCMRQSALISAAMSNIQKDLLSQPLQLLSGVDILGNASSALSNMSKGVAALSMDKKFIQSRQKQDSKGIEDIGDVIREGGGAFAKGLFRGVTGILTKPLEGAKSSGVEGFVQGVGKGIIGAAAQPVSGVLDLLSKTTEGANAVRMKIASAITSEEQLLRRRLPRAIGGDSLLRPYDEHKATGQAILQLAESGAFFSQGDLFKVRGKFALSDAYEDHFVLPKGKILIVTHRRTLLLQQPSTIMAQRKFNPARDPCSVLWDIMWDDLVTMELTYGKKDNPGSSPSRLILYLHSRSVESKENVRIIKCNRGSTQASDIYSSIELASKTYGPNASKDIHKRKVPRPIAPFSNRTSPEVYPKEVFGIWGIPEEQVPHSKNSVFGVVLPSPTRTGASHEAQQKTS